MLLIPLNASKFFKKQHANTLYCFAKRRILDESSNSMDEKNFSNENRSYNIYWEIVPLANIEGQSHEY